MSKRGFTVVEVIMSVAILMMSMLAIATFSSASTQSHQKTSFKLAVTQVKSHILSLIANEAVWRKHIQLANTKVSPESDIKINPELLCLKQGTPCIEGTYPLTIVDQSGKIVLDSNNPSQGFTRDGAVCNTYNALKTDPSCPWRLDITWTPTCRLAADGPCLRPQISIQIRVQASAQFLAENMMTTTTTINQMINQQKFHPPVARSFSVTTNSTHYGWPSTITFLGSSYIENDSPGTLTMTGPASGKTQQGGSVLVTDNLFTYTPPPGYYGSDFFHYTVTDSYTGLSSSSVVMIRVMTPWTWTGAAKDGNFSNPKNFCGRVIAGVCDGTTLTPGPYGASDVHVIFNENCTQCDVNLNSDVNAMTMELGKYYQGKVTQKANVSLGVNVANTWNKTPYFKMSGGEWIGDDTSTLTVSPTNYNDPVNEGFYLGGGDFYAPAHLIVKSDMLIANSASFHHENHTVSWTGGYPFGTTFAGDGLTQFYDFNFGTPNVTVPATYHRINVKNNFTVLNNMSISPGDTEGSPVIENSATQVILHGNLYLNNALNAGGCVPSGSVLTPLNVIFVSGSDQHIYGQSAALVDGNFNRYTCAPQLIVDKPSGKMSFHDFIALRGGLILKTADGYDFTGSTLAFAGGSGAPNMVLNTNGVPINNLAYDSEGAPQTLEVQNDLTIQGDFKYRAHWTSSGRPYIVSNVLRSTQPRYLDVKGHVYLAGASDPGTGKIYYSPILRLNGTGDQNLVGNQGQSNASDFLIEINKNSGNLNMSGSVGVFQQFKITKGNMIYAPGTSLFTQPGLSDMTHIYLDDTVLPNLVFKTFTQYHTKLNVDNFTVSAGTRINASDTNNIIYINKNLDYQGWADSTGVNLVMKGSGYTQNINFVKPSGPSYDPYISNFEVFDIKGSNNVNFSGSGKIKQMRITNGTTVNLTSSTKLNVIDEINVGCDSNLNQNGATITGTITSCK